MTSRPDINREYGPRDQWNRLNQATKALIEAVPLSLSVSGKSGIRECGCYINSYRLHLCEGHESFDEGFSLGYEDGQADE